MSYKYSKRFFDLIGSTLLIMIALPIFTVISVFIFFKGGFPILFRQRRPGLNGRPFTLYKFRTMVEKRNSRNEQLADVERLPFWGRILREMSLDELPELWNVLKGEMSLVGPRPLLMQYLDRYTVEQGRRHEIKPGITGWAQVNGRNAISWEEKFKLDVWYVDNQTILLDMKILALTVWKIIRREGIRQPGEATAKEFKGII